MFKGVKGYNLSLIKARCFNCKVRPILIEDGFWTNIKFSSESKDGGEF